MELINLPLSARSMLAFVIFYCCHLAEAQRVSPTAAPGAGGYLDIRRDGSYRYAYATGDRGRHYHTATATADNTVQGRYGERNPKTGANQETTYTAGRNGFRARGPHIARKMSLSQNKIPYNPPVNPNSPNYKPSYSGYNDPNNDPTYEFGFRTPVHNRHETSNSRGTVEGTYSYVDDVGDRHNVAYEAGSKTGFHVKTPFPDSTSIGGALFYRKPNKGGKGYRGHTAIQQNTDGSFRFTATGPDQKHTEVSDKNGNRRGSYTYLDPKGVQRTTEYIAGPGIGYKVINSKLNPQFSQSYPFLPPSFLIPSTLPDPGVNVKDEDIFGPDEGLNTAATSAGLKPGRPNQQLGGDDDDDGDDGSYKPGDKDDGLSGTTDGFLTGGGDDGDDDGSYRPTKPRPTRPRPTRPFNKPTSSGPDEGFEGSGDEGDSDEDFLGPNDNKKPEIGNFGENGQNSGEDDGFGSNDNKRPGGGGGGFGETGNKRPGSGGGGSSGGFGGSDNKRPGSGAGSGGGGFGGSDNKRPGSGGGSSGGGGGGSGGGFGGGDNKRPVGGGGNKRPNKRPTASTFGPSDNKRPTSPSFKPHNDDDDDDIFGPNAPEEYPQYGAGNDDDDDDKGSPNKFDGNDDVFGPTSPFDFNKPQTGKPPGFGRPGGRPSNRPRPTSGRPSGFGPDSHQQTGSGGDQTGNCCNNRGNSKYDTRYPYRNPQGRPPYSVRDVTYDQQSAHNTVRERFFNFPPGVAVRAHVQSLDIVPYGSRLPPPGVALEHSHKYRRQTEPSDSATLSSRR